MSTSKSTIREVFYPDELEAMRDELSRGDVLGETMAEREGRAQEIFARNRTKGEAEIASGQSQTPRTSS